MTDTRTLGERYRLLRHLARGGMADVFEAEDQLLGRRVAVKILHAQYAADRPFVQRFRREAQAAANLSHPNIVSIYDWGEQRGTYYMVMELIEGRTLRDIRRSEGALLARRAAEIAAEAAAALTVAHQAGVYHRDIKPGNIMLTGDGSVKVTDFGIARALDDSEELTRTGAVIGTATYFSPEQAQGLPADERSDIYSLGVVLYELLCGQPPFSGESPVSVAYQHVSEFAPPPGSINPDVPLELEAVVDKAMQKDPADRYATADELRNDLLRYLRGQPPTAIQAPAAAAATRLMTGAPPATVPPDETARHVAYPVEEEPSQTWYVVGIVGLLAALAIGIFFLTQIFGGSSTPDLVAVPDLAGMTTDEALDELQDLDLKIKRRNQASDTVAAGLVIETDPPPATQVEVDSVVTIVVSTGAEEFAVPTLIDADEETARELIAANRLVVGRVVYQFDEDIPEGIVIRQSPAPGEMAAPGTVVDLEVSSGPFALTVPNVIGLAEENAIRQLSRAGFEEIEVVEEYSEDIIAGFVLATEPEADTLLPRDRVLRLIVSQGQPPVVIPDLVGTTVNDAQQRLEQLGLVLLIDPATVPVAADSGLDGLIAQQSPAADEPVEVGGSVTVALGEAPRVTVPSLDGMSEAQARAAIEGLGLVFQVSGTVENAARVGQVVTQSVAPGTSVLVGSTVAVEVGIAPPTTTTTSSTTTTTTTPTTTTTTTPTTTTTTEPPPTTTTTAGG